MMEYLLITIALIPLILGIFIGTGILVMLLMNYLSDYSINSLNDYINKKKKRG